MKTDIEISQSHRPLPIVQIASKLEVDPKYVEPYGHFMAKLDWKLLEILPERKSHLILVTSINPTPYGEGKTTVSIGLHDALCELKKKSIVALREPSLGPVFGLKGGATGGGYSQVVPMEDINLHFTGDMHAITAANNLLSAAIDNHIFQGNELNLDPTRLLHVRCMDMNDRALRNIKVGDNKKNGIERSEHFVITVASEIMAILCLASSLEDLKDRLGNILIGYNQASEPVYVKDLGCTGAMTLLLKDALKPNLVQTLEENPAIIHGGPFANIAHGCNSVLATKLSLRLADYVVTEAGFGADLGAEKFLDIKCRKANLKPDVIVINTTIRSLKYNGGLENLEEESIECLEKGFPNLETHIENMLKYTNHVVVAINRFQTDTEKEISYLLNLLKEKGIPAAISTAYLEGGEGAIELAEEVIHLCEEPSTFQFLYKDTDSIQTKIETVAKEIYRAREVIYKEKALESLKEIEKMGYRHLPVCIAKTQYSLSDDPKKIGVTKDFTVTVRDLKVCSGAGFIVVYMGSVLTMPGLGKDPALLHMDIDSNGTITGLF